MLTRAELLTLTGIADNRFGALKSRGQFPIFDATPEALEDAAPSGHRRFRTWDAFGLMLLAMATDKGDMILSDVPELRAALVARVGDHILRGALEAEAARRLLRSAEPALHLRMPTILYRDGAADVHVAAALVSCAIHDVTSEPIVGTLAEIVAAAERNPIVGRGPRVVSRLFTVNASEAWRLMRDRAAAANIDLGA